MATKLKLWCSKRKSFFRFKLLLFHCALAQNKAKIFVGKQYGNSVTKNAWKSKLKRRVFLIILRRKFFFFSFFALFAFIELFLTFLLTNRFGKFCGYVTVDGVECDLYGSNWICLGNWLLMGEFLLDSLKVWRMTCDLFLDGSWNRPSIVQFSKL